MPMCKRPNQEGNVIKGPWKIKGKKEVIVPDLDVVALQENIMFADDLTETLLVQMIHTMGENGIDIGDKAFIRDIAFVVESVKSTIYRDMDLNHPMRGIMETLSKVSKDEKNNFHSEVDLELVEKLDTCFSTAVSLDLVEKLRQDMIDNEKEPEPPEVL